MSDAVGGTVNIVLIAVFMVLVSGYMAFNVSYVKAFKVKNRIIDLIEQYEGNCKPGDGTNKCTKYIHSYMNEIGYNTKIMTKSGYKCDTLKGYCIKEVKSPESVSSSSKTKTSGDTKYYYKVITQVNIDIPIMNSLMPYLSVFQVTGESQSITKRGKTK